MAVVEVITGRSSDDDDDDSSLLVSASTKSNHFLWPLWTLVSLCLFSASSGNCWCVAAYSPKVNHRAIAGLWKLTQTKQRPAPTQIVYPMKEFTVFPRDKERQIKNQQQQNSITMEEVVEHEILLMLKEDGSFQQYADDDEPQDQVTIPDTLKYHNAEDAVLERFLGRIKGKWDFVDGKLILAADRPVSEAEDTLLVGEVVATSEHSLADNPTFTNSESSESNSNRNKESSNGSPTSSAAFDTHLSIPKGEVNVGKFIYPRHHPSFFEQPMFRPTPKGKFALKQVLGSLNAQTIKAEDELIEKFRAKDFYGKRFLLTSHPLGNRRPKGNMRWSIKYNKFVEDHPTQKARKQAEEEENRPVNIRVMEVMFFANNTFATVGGLGEAIVLRGKYHIVGNERDQLWMQVWRFGFGRSVSGSVFSEGKTLTAEDEKTYWGKITYEDEHETTTSSEDGTTPIKNADAHDDSTGSSDDGLSDHSNRRLYVKGSVIFGYGLEPQPVGRFIMTETSKTDMDLDEDDEEEEDEDGMDEDKDEPADDFVDWANAFQ